jgi:hypothetical protein
MLNAPNVTGKRIRAYLSILLVPDPDGGGAGGGVAADSFPEAPTVLTLVLIRSSLDPKAGRVEAGARDPCRDSHLVRLGVEEAAEGRPLAADIVSAAFARLNGFGLEAKYDLGVAPPEDS